MRGSRYVKTVVEARFHLTQETQQALRRRKPSWGFGGLSEAVYYRTYSRSIDDVQERWADTVIRVVQGVMSIRKDWVTNIIGRRWNEAANQRIAKELADAIFEFRILSGRGLWAMGTEYVYDRGSHALNNCGAVDVKKSLATAAHWLMDSLMCGVGVGFTTNNASISCKRPRGTAKIYKIPDTKEGWAKSVQLLIASYEKGTAPYTFDYSLIRPAGAPIRGFGGTSAGHAPLQELHERLRGYLELWLDKKASATRTIADVMNAIGTCVVSGNVRRSAELALGSPYDLEFLGLKDFSNNDRSDIGWMSNNSVALEASDDFTMLPTLADAIRDNGEPGILNLVKIKKFARGQDRLSDAAVAINPCGEVPLESFELCNLAEVFPTRCTPANLNRTLELATLYASTVSLLKSHSAPTNDVVARNRRIGVSVSGIADWIDATSVAYVFDTLNHGYDLVKRTNKKLAEDAGVPASIRVTTVKPSGTVSLLAGVSSGVHYPTGGHVMRRVRIGQDSPVGEILADSGVPHEPDQVSANTEVYEFPLAYGSGNTRSIEDVPMWEQASLVAMMQTCWADNAVSNTITVQPNELKDVERVLTYFSPHVKSLSMMPDRKDVYPQMPVTRIEPAEYTRRMAAIGSADWSGLHASDGDGRDSAYCAGDACVVPV
jgi:ribonucleoside-triphosphate reductase